MATPNPEARCLITAALDIGTVYTKVKFSFRHEPNKFLAPRKLERTPTAVLLNNAGEFHSFGYEAEETYYEMLQEHKADGLALFRKFKSQLYHQERDDVKDFMLSDITSKVQKPALTIFTMTIKYIKEELLRSGPNGGFEEDDVLFVITIPSNWDDRKKAFLREAARLAGIKDSRLKLSFESEAASIFCHSLDNLTDIQKEGAKSMVIDIGGTAADIIVHETLATGNLEEVGICNGLYFGSSTFEDSFINMLTQHVGENTMNQFQSEFVRDMYELLRDLEIKKRTTKSSMTGKWRIRLPLSLIQLYRDNGPSQLPGSQNSVGMSINGDKLSIDASVAKGLFSDLTEGLTDHVRKLLKEKSFENIDTIIAVGGYSECEMVQVALANLIKSTFPSKKLVFPQQPGLATTSGSVLYGHDPSVIAARTAKFSYGLKKVLPFDESEDDKKERKNVKGRWVCERFVKLIGKNEKVPIGHEVIDTSKLFDKSPKEISICLYTSNYPDTRYISEPTCRQSKEFRTKVPKANPGEEKERAVETSIKVEDTEMKVKIKHLPSGEEKEHYLDFM